MQKPVANLKVLNNEAGIIFEIDFSKLHSGDPETMSVRGVTMEGRDVTIMGGKEGHLFILTDLSGSGSA